MGLKHFVNEVLNTTAKQLIIDKGFDDGVNGRPPRMWTKQSVQEVYDEGYQKGQNAMNARLMNRTARYTDEE